MASISHHKIKGYRVHWRFTVRSGPRTGESVTGSLLLGRCSKAAAKAHLRKVEAWEASVKTGERVADASWEEVRDAWLRERELIYTEQTLARAKRVLDMYERWRKERELPCQTIEQVARRQDVTNWRNHRLDGQAGRKTVANDFSTLAELFRWCVLEKYLPDNPMDRIARPRFIMKKEGTPLTREQAGRWLWSIKPKPDRGACGALTLADVRRKRQIGVFLLNTGVRNGELCSLDVDDLRIDDDAQLLHVLGKGLKHRWVPLNRAALAAVRLHLRSRGNLLHGPLFVTRSGGRYNVRQLAGELRKSANGCGEDLQVNAHNLRHTFATWLVRTVANASLAQKILGHENVNTTLKYYVHTGDWELAGATNNLRPKRRGDRASKSRPLPEPGIIQFPRMQVG